MCFFWALNRFKKFITVICNIISAYLEWYCSVVVITTAQLHSTKLKLKFCTGSNPAHVMLEIHDGEDLWQWSWLEIRLHVFPWLTIPRKQFIIHHHHHHLEMYALKVLNKSGLSLQPLYTWLQEKYVLLLYEFPQNILEKFPNLLLLDFKAVNCSTRAFLGGRGGLQGHLIFQRKKLIWYLTL